MTKTRSKLNLASDHPALVLFDVFKGNLVDNVRRLLEESCILYVVIPANCTDKLQPLDLSVNKPAKDFLRKKFQEWYGDIVYKQLESGTEETVDLRLSVMKPLTAQWAIDMFIIITLNLIQKSSSMGLESLEL